MPIGHRVDFSVQRPFHRVGFSVVSTEFSTPYSNETLMNKGFLRVPYLMPISISMDDSMMADVGGFVVWLVMG